MSLSTWRLEKFITSIMANMRFWIKNDLFIRYELFWNNASYFENSCITPVVHKRWQWSSNLSLMFSIVTGDAVVSSRYLHHSVSVRRRYFTSIIVEVLERTGWHIASVLFNPADHLSLVLNQLGNPLWYHAGVRLSNIIIEWLGLFEEFFRSLVHLQSDSGWIIHSCRAFHCEWFYVWKMPHSGANGILFRERILNEKTR